MTRFEPIRSGFPGARRRRTGAVRCTLAAALVALVQLSAANADVAALVKECEDCHGVNGASEWPDTPVIGGASSGVHADFLIAYREKERPCVKAKYHRGDVNRPQTDMCAIASKLSDADIDALAEHFAALSFVPAKQQADPTKAAAGKKLHAVHCEKCHTGGGRDADADASILAGQWMPYLERSLQAFADGSRPMPKKMKEKLDKLTPADLDALVHYYGGAQ